MRLRVGSKIILLSGALLLFSGCGGGGGGDTGGSDTQPAESVTYSSYDISIVDDNILHAKLTAVGCSGFEEIGKGKYRLTQCSKKPDIIVASGGYIDFDDDGEVDENDTAMGLPLMLDTRQTDKNDSFVVTPLTTLAASVSNDTELGTIAKKFGLKKEDLFSDLSKTENRKILQLLNAQYIAAQENGVIDVPRFLRTLKDKIIDDDTNDANASAVIENAVRKITEDTSMRTLFGGIGFNGFVTEINAIDPENLATTFYAKQTISPDKTVFVGFVYDEPIQNASVTIYIGDTKAGEASTDVNGKFRIAVETSLLEKDAIVRFEAELEDYKGDHVKLTSVTTTKALREIAKQRISPSDFIDFIISNVTTAEYVVAKKLNGGKEFSEPKQLEEKLVEAQVNHPVTIKKAAALLKAVIDTNETIGTDTNDTTESDTLTYIEGKIVTTDEGGIDIDLTSDEETEVENYTVKMENDPVLSQQLNSVEYTSAKTTLKTLADAGKAKFYSIDVSIEPNEIIKEYTRINFTPTTFERSEYERKSDAWVEEEKETATGNYDADGAFYVTDPRKEPEKIWIVSSATIYNDYLHKYYTLYTIAHGLYKPHDAAYYTSMFDGEYADKFTLDASMTSWNDLEKAINDNGYDFDGYHLTKDGNATNEHAVKWEHFEVEGKDFIRVVRDNDDDNRLYALDFANHAVYQKWELDEETIGKFKYELTITSFDLVTAYQFLPNNKIEEFFSKYKTEEERENAIRTFINDLITATELKEDDTTSDNGGSEESAESATSSNTSFAIPVTESMTFYEFEIEKEYDGIDIKKDLHTLEGGKVVSKEYEFDLEKGEWVEETHDDYILTAGGWVKESGLEETYVLNSDGSATIDDGFVVGIEEAIDLGNTTFTEAGSDGIEIAVPMPAGATMYKNSYTTLVDQYWIWDKKSVWVDGNRTEVTSFDELIQSQCGLNWFRGDSNGGIAFAPSSNEDGTFAKDNNGNYICNTAASSGTLVEVKRNADGSVNIVDENAGQWSIETVSGQQILVVRPENEAYYKDSDGEVEYPIFAMYDGAIWEGEMEPAGMTMTWTSYNETAFNALVNYVETHYKEIASFDTDDSVSDSNVTDENASTMFKFTADYLTGRTLYLVTYDDFGDENNLQWNMASLAFDSDKFVWHEYDTNDSGYYDVPYTLTPEGYIQFTGTDEENRTTTGTVEPVEYSDDYIKVCETEDNGDRTIQNCSSYFFFDEAKAIAFRDNQNGNNGVSDSNVTDENASTTSTTTDYIYITEEMLDGRVFYEKMNEDDGGYGYAKMTPTATDATRHEIWYNSDGSVREDNTFSVPFELIDGKLRAETPEEYKWFTLMKEDETAWYLINDDDVDKDGTIDQAGEENIWYLSKPADFPENL